MVEKITSRSNAPYYDDFDEAKNFLQVLYRPSFPVQSRELTTSQSILLEQVKRFADFNFKDGARINGANLTLDTSSKRLSVTGNSSTSYPTSLAASNSVFSTVNGLVGKIISNESGTVKAQVLTGLNSSTITNTGNIYIRYLTVEEFNSNGGFIYAKPEDNPTLTQTLFSTFESLSDCTLANIETGIYYIKGLFTRVAKQSIILSETSKLVSAEIGLVAQEKVITQNDDPTLFDNSRGTTNEGAPGAHRLTLELVLDTSTLGSVSDPNFYRIATIIDSVIQERVQIDERVNSLLDILAERTYDESGDYTVTSPKVVVNYGDSEDVFNVKINPFKAYVKGYSSNFAYPINIAFNKGMENQKTTRNYTTAISGTPFFYVDSTSISGTLPGTTSGGNPYLNTSRLKLFNSGGDVIGVCRAYAINDEIEKGILKTKLYVYDVKMLQIIQPSASVSIAEGNDFYAGKTRGYVYTQDGVNGITNGIGIINSTDKFRVGQTFKSDVAGVSGTISAVHSYSISDVTNIQNVSGSFTVNVETGTTIQNSESSLVYQLNKKVKTFKDGSASIMDNDFSVIMEDSDTNLNAANGDWRSFVVNDQEENAKSLKFAYVKIKNSSNRSSSNYGWLATDKEITLFYPDIFKVYGVNQSSDSTFANGQFTRLNISTTGIIPQGIILTGSTSGAEVIVVLSNSINTYASRLSNTSGFHETVKGTGSTSLIEVIKLNNKDLIEGEALLPRPVEETNKKYSSTTVDFEDAVYQFAITFVKVESDSVGNNVNNLFNVDTGQRDEFYDVGRLVRKNNTSISNTGDLIVFYSYFESGSKNYYSADSYSAIDYFDYDVRFNKTELPIQLKQNTNNLDLRDALDFRLRSNSNVIDITKSPFVFSNRTFFKQAKILPNSKFTTDITEFLGRKDSVYLDKYGKIRIKTGLNDSNPKPVAADNDSMKLFDINIPAAVRYPDKEVIIDFVDNKRYTMRDIGKIESRINRLEETVALTMLESQALHDDIGGRTKMGFIVDDFSTVTDFTSTPADFNHEEFNSSFNILSKELISAQTEGVSVGMNISDSTNVSNFFPNYVIKNFVEEEMVKQPNSTSTYKINPFAVWNFIGETELTPPFDTWKIRENNYFTNNNGIITRFTGDSDNWEDFLQITTASPGGISTTRTEWGGWQQTSSVRRGRRTTTTDTRVGTNITTTNFDQPRAVSGTLPVETLTGSKVIPNPQDYFMRPIRISYDVKGLMPNTDHSVFFGNELVVDTIKSDSKGLAKGSFVIPPMRIRAGTESFVIRDKLSGATSYSSAIFTSTGILETFDVVQNVSSSTVSREAISDTRTRVEVEEDRDNGDPIAQLFKLPLDTNLERTSSILTSIDIWFGFVDTRTSMDKVIVEIRETVNGYPAGYDKILGSTGEVTISKANEVTIPSNTNATNLKFTRPIKLEGDKEYAIVILSPSAETTVFVAELGKNKVDGSGIHSSQPNVGGYYGSFFVSQNSSSWSAEQNIDLTFRLNRADFDLSDSTVTYSNSISDKNIYNANIGDYYQGSAIETFENSNYVKIYHPNHGLNFTNAKAFIERIEQGTYHGIPSTELLGLHDVYYPTLNSYFIKTVTKATQSGFINTPSVFAKQSIVYDGMYLNLFAVRGSDDNIKIEYKGATTNSIELLAASDKISYPLVDVPVSDTTFIEISDGELINFTNPKIVRNTSNATGNDLTIKLTLESNNKYSSPYFRKDVSHNPVVFRNLTGYMLDDSDLEELTVTTVTDSDDDDTNQKLASYYAGVTSVTENNAYVTKQIDLELPADGLTIFFDAAMFSENEIEFYYKAKVSGDETPFNVLDWVQFPANQFINETNYGTFGTEEQFKNYEARVALPIDFQSFKIKILTKTKNEALVPKIKNLRIISDV